MPDGWRSPRGDGADWTPEEDAIVRKGWNEGLTARRIAMALGGGRRTRFAVISRARRLGLPARESPIRHGAPAPKPLDSRLSSTYQVAGHASGLITRGWEKCAVHGCQWIEGDARSGEKCGAPVLPGRAWCLEHYVRVYLPAERSAQKKEG